MRSRISNDLGKKAAAWLATSFVVTAGLTTCVVLAVLFFEKPLVPLLWIGGSTAGVSLLLWLLRDRSDEDRSSNLNLLAWMLRRSEADAPRTAVRVGKKPCATPVEYGTNAPPSVEQIREAANDARTWVPPSNPKQARAMLGDVWTAAATWARL